MDNFFERLCSVIHWIGFLISLGIAYMFLTMNSTNPLWLDILITLFPNTVGWLIKYIFTGNGKFFPL